MNIEHLLKTDIAKALQDVFGASIEPHQVELQPTNKGFEGSHTFVAFSFAKNLRKKPDEIALQIGEYLQKETLWLKNHNVVKGFLNLSIKDDYWTNTLLQVANTEKFGFLPSKHEKVMVEYSSPNTNKPLHLGHLRNNFLGYSTAQILHNAGYEVMKVNLVNDRGIHICKSMLIYQKEGNGETPESAQLKGDHLIGKYYVKFDKLYKEQIKTLEEQGLSKEKAEKEAPLMKETQEMLRKWEAGDEEVLALWKKMNTWVLDGFAQTYAYTGISFDKYYYESNTYLLGKEIIAEGLEKGVFYKKEDGSVWIDLSGDGLDHKLVLRADGTSVYITQDMGTADLKYEDFKMKKSVYVVGNEQDYHFQVLKLILQKLGRPYADGIYHLSYGMVELPEGKMKTREGTVVDADNLIDEMVQIAEERTKELGKIEDFTTAQAQELYKTLALGALKYYLLRVDPKKKMLFNPQESIDFQGNSGVYIQYTHAKISAIVRKAKQLEIAYSDFSAENIEALHETEMETIKLISEFPQKIEEAAQEYAPSVIANYMYELAKTYSRFYAELSIFGEQNPSRKALRVLLSEQVARILKLAGTCLGMEMPERM